MTRRFAYLAAVSFTLITHNAYWFQGMPFEGTDPGSARAEIVSGLAKLYRGCGASVLCLQELQSQEAYAAISSALGMNGRYKSGRTLTQYGGAMLFRDGEFSCDDAMAAKPVQRFWIKMRGRLEEGSEIVICNVHLPSNRQVSVDQAALARVEELKGMLAAGPRPDVVAGDFNEFPGGGVQKLMEAEGFVDLAPRFSHGETDTHTRKHARRIDYVWAREPLARRAAAFRVSEPDELALGGGRFLSDHLPIVVAFE